MKSETRILGISGSLRQQLVALAEQHHLHRIFTLDKDFRVYRLKGRRQFDIVP